MDEGRKRVIGIMAAILTSIHMRTADDPFGTPQGSPRTDKLIAASVQWAEKSWRRLMSGAKIEAAPLPAGLMSDLIQGFREREADSHELVRCETCEN